jgi:hypothetical protein
MERNFSERCSFQLIYLMIMAEYECFHLYVYMYMVLCIVHVRCVCIYVCRGSSVCGTYLGDMFECMYVCVVCVYVEYRHM